LVKTLLHRMLCGHGWRTLFLSRLHTCMWSWWLMLCSDDLDGWKRQYMGILVLVVLFESGLSISRVKI
jgi:hypothetical protein